MYELELKIPVPDLAPFRMWLEDLGARFYGSVVEEDTYYRTPDRDFAVTDEALRLRWNGTIWSLTYKGPKIGIAGVKAREEHNLAIESGEVCEKILYHIGFRRAAVVRKVRETYQIDGASVMLDDVDGLGTFVEVEVITHDRRNGAAAILRDLAEKLGLPDEHITASYLELLLAQG